MRLFALMMLLLALLSTACARKPMDSAGYYESDEDYSGYGGEPAPMMDYARSVSKADTAKMESRAQARAEESWDEPPGAATAQPAAPVAASRMVHYDGWIRLRVVRPDETTDLLTARANEVGGYVERIGGGAVTIRVPVDRFQEVFDGLLKLGDVLDKAISAEDVTDAFTAVDLRLQTARATRDRLVELLGKSVDEKEKLALVKEIQEVSEEIDRLESQVRTLSTLASFSRITVELVPRVPLTWQGDEQETAEFAWIRQLSPFNRRVTEGGKRLELDVPDGMVQLSPKRRFVVESPDGARMWAAKLDNAPRGDAAFWMDAIQQRLAPEFASAEVSTVGGFTVLRLVDRGDEPYTWLVAVRVEGDKLHLVEVYFPTRAQEERFGPAVRAAMSGGAA